MMAALRSLVRGLVMLPIVLWQEAEETIRHQTLVKRLDENRMALDAVRKGQAVEKIRMAITSDEAEAQVAKDQLGALLAEELRLLAVGRGIQRQIVCIGQER